MIQYVIAGLVLGGIYAIASAGLVVTYRAAGILNFGFGALAYFIARLYYYLHTQEHWGIAPAGLVSVLLVSPALGVALYFGLFRMLRLSSTLVKVVVTLGVSVCIPALAEVLFGDSPILTAPGLAPEPVRVFRIDNVPVTMDQLIVYACVIMVLVIGGLVLRYTDVGLRVRAMVDSPAMTSLSGTNPKWISAGVWAVSVFLAGLAGVLSAPIIGLAPTDYTLLMAAAFAAVIAARLRNLPIALVVGFAMGVLGSLVQYYLPPNSPFTAAAIPSIPFVVIAIFLIYHMLRRGKVSEADGVGGALDLAIAPHGASSLAGAAESRRSERGRKDHTIGWSATVVMVAVVAVLPLTLPTFWLGLLVLGIAYAVVFLSFTLVTGEGGMISLCQVTFAGIGAIAAAQFATRLGWPVPVAIIMGGLVALPVGVIIGFVTIRLGDLYVALVTLTFGLLMDNLVFSQNIFLNGGLGVTIGRPGFAVSNQAMSYVGLVLFGIVAVLIVNLRHSTTGLALGAVRSSEPGAKTLGIPVLRMKAILIGLAACVAGIGGGLLAVVNGAAVPDDFATLAGVVWLAVLVTAGIRSNMAALIAGIMFAIVPGLVLAYLPASWNQLPPILFGLGAIALAKNPEGFVLQNGRALRAVAARWLNCGSRAPGARVTAATVDTVDPTPGRTKPRLIKSDGRP